MDKNDINLALDSPSSIRQGNNGQKNWMANCY